MGADRKESTSEGGTDSTRRIGVEQAIEKEGKDKRRKKEWQNKNKKREKAPGKEEKGSTWERDEG
jgi:hypothetical protein